MTLNGELDELPEQAFYSVVQKQKIFNLAKSVASSVVSRRGVWYW